MFPSQTQLTYFKLKGIDDISDARLDTSSMLLSFDNENREVIENNEIVIYTSGINMEELRYIEGIDLIRTYCNEINTINKQFGIEAARSALLTEFSNVFTFCAPPLGNSSPRIL